VAGHIRVDKTFCSPAVVSGPNPDVVEVTMVFTNDGDEPVDWTTNATVSGPSGDQIVLAAGSGRLERRAECTMTSMVLPEMISQSGVFDASVTVDGGGESQTGSAQFTVQ
jgi:hypothetical protein